MERKLLYRFIVSLVAALIILALSASIVFASVGANQYKGELSGPHFDRCPYYEEGCDNCPDNDGIHLQIRDRDRTCLN